VLSLSELEQQLSVPSSKVLGFSLLCPAFNNSVNSNGPISNDAISVCSFDGVGPVQIGGQSQCLDPFNNVYQMTEYVEIKLSTNDDDDASIHQGAHLGNEYTEDDFGVLCDSTFDYNTTATNSPPLTKENVYYFPISMFLSPRTGIEYKLVRQCNKRVDDIPSYYEKIGLPCYLPPTVITGYRFARPDRTAGGNGWYKNLAPLGKQWSTQATRRVPSLPTDNLSTSTDRSSSNQLSFFAPSSITMSNVYSDDPIPIFISDYNSPITFPVVSFVNLYGEAIFGKMATSMKTTVSISSSSSSSSSSFLFPFIIHFNTTKKYSFHLHFHLYTFTGHR
jgi:hypothetical protein